MLKEGSKWLTVFTSVPFSQVLWVYYRGQSMRCVRLQIPLAHAKEITATPVASAEPISRPKYTLRFLSRGMQSRLSGCVSEIHCQIHCQTKQPALPKQSSRFNWKSQIRIPFLPSLANRKCLQKQRTYNDAQLPAGTFFESLSNSFSTRRLT